MSMNFSNFNHELDFRTSRSSGAGGQHVNTTETKVELIFNIFQSIHLTDEQKAMFFAKWKNRINDSGEFKICSSQHRSQASNKEHVIKKFHLMLEKALKKEKKRIATSVPRAVKENILNKKKLHSDKKSGRRKNTREYLS